jgi:hypothetical protein
LLNSRNRDGFGCSLIAMIITKNETIAARQLFQYQPHAQNLALSHEAISLSNGRSWLKSNWLFQ